MLRDALMALVDLGQKAKSVELVTHEKLPDKVFVRHGEELEEHDVPPPRRSSEIHDLADLIKYLQSGIAPYPEVYVSRESVRAYLHREDRRDQVFMPMTLTHRFSTLWGLANKVTHFSPKEAIALLRFDLYGNHSPAMISALRKVDFTRRNTGENVTEHGRESLGRSVEAEVQQAAEIPDEFLVSVPIYQEAGLRSFEVTARVCVYLDAQNEAIRLIPLKDEIEASWGNILGEIRDSISNQSPGGPVYRGHAG